MMVEEKPPPLPAGFGGREEPPVLLTGVVASIGVVPTVGV
jgi:hypothetical protein